MNEHRGQPGSADRRVPAIGRAPAAERDAASALGLRLDCRHYRGDRPCVRGCQGGCEYHEPMGQRILVIKLGALGDVIRTAAVLPGLKDLHPRSHVTWVSRPNGCRILAGHPLIDRLLPFDAETLCHLPVERFDLVVSLDKEAAPAGLAMRVEAPDKRGIGLSSCGTAFPLNPEAYAYFRLGLDDRLKFEANPHSYQRLIYEALGLSYDGQRYTLHPGPDHCERARSLFAAAGVAAHEDIIGLNTGAGRTFANKCWPEQRFVELGRRLMRRGDCRVALLGGPEERARNQRLAAALGPGVVHTGCDLDELDFAAVVQRCSAVLTGDTTAMHVAIALRVPAVVLFGPTCPQEVDLYGRGRKLIAKIDCAPCYKRHCDLQPNCMDVISVDQAEAVLVGYLGRRKRPSDISLDVVAGRDDDSRLVPNG